jgi:uncharacterized protein (DUF934 family)
MAWLLEADGSKRPLEDAAPVEWVISGDADWDHLSLSIQAPKVSSGNVEQAPAPAHWRELKTIAIELPKFSDGRAYSLARLITQRTEFTGELRAQGDVLVDQVLPLARVGFTSFALREDQAVDAAIKALKAFTVMYQQAALLPTVKP